MNTKVFEEIFPDGEHPDAGQLALYAEGKMTGPLARQIEVHIASCGLCSDALDGIMEMKDPGKLAGIADRLANEAIEKHAGGSSEAAPSFGWVWYIAAGIILLLSAVLFFGPGGASADTVVSEIYPEPVGLMELTAGNNESDSQVLQAEKALRSGRYPLAMELTESIPGKDALYHYGRLIRAQAYLRKSSPDPETAFIILQSIISHGENEYVHEADWLLGQVYLQNENMEAARGHFKRFAAMESSPFQQEAKEALEMMEP